jgi:amino acid transporter
MSELDEQKAKIDWYKELFRTVITVILALSAGLAGLMATQNTGILFYLGVSGLIVLGIVAAFAAGTVSKEIRKLRDM